MPRDLLGRRDRDQEPWGHRLSVLYIAIFIGFIFFLAMCTCLCWGRRTVHMSAVPVEAREGISSCEAIVTSGCEPPDNGCCAGKRTSVLWKSSKCSWGRSVPSAFTKPFLCHSDLFSHILLLAPLLYLKLSYRSLKVGQCTITPSSCTLTMVGWFQTRGITNIFVQF